MGFCPANKKSMKKILISIISFLVLGAVAIWFTITFFPELLVPIMLNQQMKRLNQNSELLSDTQGITVFTVGTSSPLPGVRAQSGTAIFVNGHFFMFDVGDGVVQKAETIGLPLDKIDGVFITHWHSDHFMDLPNIINRSWILGRNNDLPIYGPTGLDTIMYATNNLLSIESGYRVAHHGAEIMDIKKSIGVPYEFDIAENEKKIVYEKDEIKITAFDVSHEPIEPAVGYAIEYQGKKVVISGDTKKNALVLEMAKNADLLLHEVLLKSLLEELSNRLEGIGNTRNSTIITDIQDYHTSPEEVADLANEAGVKKLVLHHFAPAPDLKVVENLYRKELNSFDGELHFANDGDKIIIK
jgi:ribonuclease Z